MLSVFDGLREMTLFSVTARVLLSILCGGIIGIGREYRRQPAGFRTHMLICLGAAVTVMTSQHVMVNMKLYTDMGRMGAQVVAGIGFIGTGAIVKTRGKIRGITTAAGLWTSGVIGLAVGFGFLEAAFLGTALVAVVEGVLPVLEKRLSRTPVVNFYLEYSESETFQEVIRYIRSRGLKIMDLEVARAKSNEKHNACAIVMLRLNGGYPAEMVKAELKTIRGMEQCEIL